jgi:uncharacterized membrane protein YedE/YeeE
MAKVNYRINSSIPDFKNFLGIVAILIIAFILNSQIENLQGGTALSLSLWLGIAFGAVLQKSRFCFYCISRDFIEIKNAKGLLGIVVALVVGTLGYHLIFGAFLIDPVAPRLPPNAHIAPVSWVLVLGSFSFGLGMAIAGSCISAQLYRFGEGLLSALIAFIGIILGFVLAFLSWNFLYLKVIQQAPLIWFPHYLGYKGSIVLQIILLIFLALLLLKFHKKQKEINKTQRWWEIKTQRWWEIKWPTYVGGILVALIATVAFLRISPLGVTAEIGSVARTSAGYFNILPARLEGLDTLRGCLTIVKETFWSNNGLFIFGLVLGSFALATFSGDFKIQIPKIKESVRSFVGGILMGFGSMIALGCTVGTLLSGIMAASLSGWIFLVFCGTGLYLGWFVRKKYKLN